MLGLKLVLGFVSFTIKASLMGNGQMTAKRDVRVCDFVFIKCWRNRRDSVLLLMWHALAR